MTMPTPIASAKRDAMLLKSETVARKDPSSRGSLMFFATSLSKTKWIDVPTVDVRSTTPSTRTTLRASIAAPIRVVTSPTAAIAR